MISDFFFLSVNGGNASSLQFFIFYGIDVGFFFIYLYLVLPSMWRTRLTIYKPIALFLGGIFFHVLLQLCYYGILYGDIGTLFQTVVTHWSNSKPYIFNTVYRAFQIYGLSIVFWGAMELKTMSRKERISESYNLYARVSPHLLFNALNTVNASTQASTDEKGKEMILLLARYARNAMADFEPDGKSALSLELEQLNTLIRINVLRFGEIYLNLITNLPVETDGIRIPPQLIVSLAENIFKYGIVDDPASPAVIRIDLQDQYLFIEMKNNISESISYKSSDKIGIANVNRRLENIYQLGYSFQVEERDGIFIVNLIIPI